MVSYVLGSHVMAARRLRLLQFSFCHPYFMILGIAPPSKGFVIPVFTLVSPKKTSNSVPSQVMVMSKPKLSSMEYWEYTVTVRHGVSHYVYTLHSIIDMQYVKTGKQEIHLCLKF